MIYTARYNELPKEEEHSAVRKLLTIGFKIEENIDYYNEPIEISPMGKPSLKNHPDIYYNVSHCNGCVAIAISRKYQVGIDVEDIKRFTPAVAEKVCTQKELSRIYSSPHPNTEFFKHWTLKESFIKAVGIGLYCKMRDVEFDVSDRRGIKSNQKDCEFMLIKESKYILAVCCKGIK